MMLAADFLSKPMKIGSDSVSVLSVENKKLYRDIVGAFVDEHPEEMNIVFSQDFKPFKYKGNVCFVNDYYKLDLSSAIIKKLYENLERFCNDEMQEETNALKVQIFNFLDRLVLNYDYDFNYSLDINIVDLFKIQNLKPYITSKNLLCSLLDFIVIIKKYTHIRCFVLLNLHLYFTDEEIVYLYEDLIYNDISVLVLENSSNFSKSKFETIRIIDNDLCEIVEK